MMVIITIMIIIIIIIFIMTFPTLAPQNHTHSIPNCRIIETGWDKGNWTVLLEKISDTRLTPGLAQIGPECAIPTLHIRK